MSTDPPPTGYPADEAPVPASAEPTQPLGQAEPTRAIPAVEPTQPIPTFEPLPPGVGGWTHVETASPPEHGADPPGTQPWATTPPAVPNPPNGPYPGQAYGPSGRHPGAQWYAAQPAPQGWAPPGPQGWAPPSGPPVNWTAAPPQPLAGNPPPLAPPPRGRGWLVALATLAAVVMVSLIAALAVPQLLQLSAHRGGAGPTPSASRGGTPTKPTASPTPTSKPTKTMPSDPLAVLKKNPIYALKVPAKCPKQAIPRSPTGYRTQVGKLVTCLNTAWKKALASTPVEFKKPKVKFYSTAFSSPCGRLGTTFPASYCTANSTLYFSKAAYAQGRYFRLSVAQFVFHEYAHHVQKLAGVFGSTQAMKENGSVTKRRIELQAHCMSHYGLVVSSVGFGSDDERAIKYQWDYTNDPKGHGSTKAERYWGERGLNAKTVGACNTWSAKASRVK